MADGGVKDTLKGTVGSPVLLSTPIAPSGVEALGRTHYSYGIAARNFVRMMKESGIDVVPVRSPEQFKTPLYAQSLGLETSGHAHLIFRSTEEIRAIPGAYNIACFAWEFDVLSEQGLGQVSVLHSQTTMLGMCDELWAPSRFTQQVLIEHGLRNCRFIPAPIFMPELSDAGDHSAWSELQDVMSCELVSQSTNFLFGYETDFESDYQGLEDKFARPLGDQKRLQDVIKRGGKIFTSVLNPYDKRKNLANLIEGFLLAAQGRDDLVLVLKLITSGVVEKPAGYLYHQLRLILGHPHCVHDDKIILVGGYLSDAEMEALYRGSNFYLCTSIAEGQNVPILEAMSHGCVPVSTRNTAMADYLTNENSIKIEEKRFPSLISGLAGDVAGRRYSVDFCDRYDVASAISSAAQMTFKEIRRLSLVCREMVQAKYAAEVVAPLVIERLSDIGKSVFQQAVVTGPGS